MNEPLAIEQLTVLAVAWTQGLPVSQTRNDTSVLWLPAHPEALDEVYHAASALLDSLISVGACKAVHTMD